MNVMARDARFRSAILVVEIWFALSLASSPLRAEPLDRQVAEWVILSGGSVRLEGQDGRIRELTKLPAADFRLELADLVGTNINPPDLQRLSGLTRLKTLNLPGPMWNPSAELEHRQQPRAAPLGEHSFARGADLQLHLSRIDQFRGHRDRSHRGAAPSLRLLSLENTQVRGRHLAPFTNLEALDLVYCPVNDEGLRQMQGLTKLRDSCCGMPSSATRACDISAVS